jgi:hypothetical protein
MSLQLSPSSFRNYSPKVHCYVLYVCVCVCLREEMIPNLDDQGLTIVPAVYSDKIYTSVDDASWM